MSDSDIRSYDLCQLWLLVLFNYSFRAFCLNRLNAQVKKTFNSMVFHCFYMFGTSVSSLGSLHQT